MEKRRYFRIRDQLPLLIFHHDRRLFPINQLNDEAPVVMSIQKMAAVFKRLFLESSDIDWTESAIRRLLLSHLSGASVEADYEEYGELCDVSLSEGGIGIDLPARISLPAIGEPVAIRLTLETNLPPIQVEGLLVGADTLSSDKKLCVRFEFFNVNEADRQRIFRYVFKQQTKRINGLPN